jgi:hypothetical protein
VPALCERLTGALRIAVSEAAKEFRATYEAHASALEKSAAWQQISEADRARILADRELSPPAPVNVGTEDEVVRALERTSLDRWAERRDALQSRFARALEAAAKLLTPKARKVSLPPATLSSEPEVESWVTATRELLLKEVANGPVIL